MWVHCQIPPALITRQYSCRGCDRERKLALLQIWLAVANDHNQSYLTSICQLHLRHVAHKHVFAYSGKCLCESKWMVQASSKNEYTNIHTLHIFIPHAFLAINGHIWSYVGPYIWRTFHMNTIMHINIYEDIKYICESMNGVDLRLLSRQLVFYRTPRLCLSLSSAGLGWPPSQVCVDPQTLTIHTHIYISHVIYIL